jgi:hypothetical protein
MEQRAFEERLATLDMPRENFFYRTLQDGPFSLTHPHLLAAVQALHPVVFLDTMVRFSKAQSENAADEIAHCLSEPCLIWCAPAPSPSWGFMAARSRLPAGR